MEQRIRKILANLASIEEDLLALSDDIWLNIDHNDSEAVKSGAEFKVSYNEGMQEFTRAVSKLSNLIRIFTKVSIVPSDVVMNSVDRVGRERIILELNKRLPHSLEEDFRYKRPFGFKLQGVPYSNLNAWQHIYEAVCKHFAKDDPDRFNKLPDDPAFTSSRGNKYFSRTENDLRVGREFLAGIFAEVNLSANQIRDNIKRLMEHFSIPQNEFVAYFREDRNAKEANQE